LSGKTENPFNKRHVEVCGTAICEAVELCLQNILPGRTLCLSGRKAPEFPDVVEESPPECSFVEKPVEIGAKDPVLLHDAFREHHALPLEEEERFPGRREGAPSMVNFISCDRHPKARSIPKSPAQGFFLLKDGLKRKKPKASNFPLFLHPMGISHHFAKHLEPPAHPKHYTPLRQKPRKPFPERSFLEQAEIVTGVLRPRKNEKVESSKVFVGGDETNVHVVLKL
jgi:hypothetical protein